MKRTILKPYPTTRLGWHAFYVKKFNENGSSQAAHLANWYLLLYLSEGERK